MYRVFFSRMCFATACTPKYDSICHHMPPYATICLHMPLYATIRLYMPIALKVWYKILVELHMVCLHMPLYATICHYMPPYATICHYMPPYATICLHMPLYASKGMCLCGFAGVHQHSNLSLFVCVTYIFMCCQSLVGFCCSKLHAIRAARERSIFCSQRTFLLILVDYEAWVQIIINFVIQRHCFLEQLTMVVPTTHHFTGAIAGR